MTSTSNIKIQRVIDDNEDNQEIIFNFKNSDLSDLSLK